MMISKGKILIGTSQISYKTSFLNYLLLYSLFLPTINSLISLLVTFLIKIKIERFYKARDSLFKLNDLKSLENLNLISYVLMDKTGTMTNGNVFLRSIYIPKKMYIFKELQPFSSSTPKILKNHSKENANHEYCSKISSSDLEIPAEKKHFSQKNIVRDFFFNKVNKIPFKQDFLVSKKFSLEMDFHSNINMNKPIGFEIEEEFKNKIDNKNLLSPYALSKRNGKESLNFSMRMSKFLAKTNPSYKNVFNVIPEFTECDESIFQEDVKNDEVCINTIKALLLCHNAKTLFREGNTLKFFHTNEEVEIIKFCSQIGFRFERILKFQNKLEYMINVNDHIIKYDVIGINYCAQKNGRGCFSIVLKNLEGHSDNAILIAKGPHEYIINSLEIKEKKRNEIIALINSENNKGRRAVIYAMRELDKAQIDDYLLNYNALHSNFSIDDLKLQEFYSQMEVKLKLICILFIEDCLKPHLLPSIRLFSDLNIKIWVLTGDSYDRTYCTAFLSKILSLEDNLSYIKCSTLQEAQLSLTNNLKLLKRLLGYQPDNANSLILIKIEKTKATKVNDIAKLCLFADGKSLDLILSDETLADHLCFLLFFCKVFIGYDLSPFHKGILARKIKEKYINEPLVLAIGDGFNDNLMFEGSDCSIGIIEKDNLNNKAQIQISGWEMIPSLMINSLKLINVLQNLYEFLYSSFILYFFSNFYYAWYNNFNGSGIYKNSMIFFIFFLQIGAFSLNFCFFQLSKKESMNSSIKIKYRLNNSSKSKIRLKFIYFSAIIPLIIVLWSFYFGFYCLIYYFGSTGFETTLETIQSVFLISFFSFNTIRVNNVLFNIFLRDFNFSF